MSKLLTPFRYDFVGSFLRPEELKTARAEFEAGRITAEELKEVEDTCIRELVEKQKSKRTIYTKNKKSFCKRGKRQKLFLIK